MTALWKCFDQINTFVILLLIGTTIRHRKILNGYSKVMIINKI